MSDEITAYPLQGYSTATLKGLGILLNLQLLARHPQHGEVMQEMPLQLLPAQARALAQSLLNAAEASEMGQSPSSTRN